MLREFALHLEATYLFPVSFQGSGKLASSSGNLVQAPLSKQFLQRKEFLNLMEETEYALIRPHELRKRYTEFVTFNKARALLPSKKKKLKKGEKAKKQAHAINESASEMMIETRTLEDSMVVTGILKAA